MRKLSLLLLLSCACIVNNSFAQVSLTVANGSYNENFDVMGSTTSYPAGWTGIRFAGTGTPANATLTPVVSAGTSNTGGIHNVGAVAAVDRALGTLASGATIPAFGVSFVNNTGSAITGFSISGVHEQWRTGNNALVETIIFEYSSDATSLSTGTWTAISSLDLVEILTANNTNTAADGNVNKVAISGSASLLNIPVGGNFWLRWRDADNTGSDGIYAVDDLQMNYSNGIASTTVSVSSGINAAEPATDGTFNVTLSSPAPAGGVTVNYTLSGGTAVLSTDYTDPQSGSITISQGNTSAIITLDVNDDPDFEGTETIAINLDNASNGYTIATGNASINLLDNDAAPTVSVTAGTSAAEPATSGTLTISFSTATVTSTDISFAYTGTAGFGTDYTVSYSTGTPNTSASGGILTVPPGVSSITVTITPVNDPDVEGPETITLTLSAPTAGYVIGTGGATINITSEDIPPQAPVSLTGAVYTQDFNSLSNTGTTNNLIIQGWLMNETGGGARDNEQYAADNGGSTTGDTYSYGLTASTERALGGLQSGSLVPSIGAYFVNNTGNTVSRLKITYTGEQWRLGTINRTDKLDFQYSLDATSLTTGTWIDMDLLDFTSPFTTTAGTLNGNTNIKLLSFTITGLSIPNGAVFYIRWNSIDATGADDALAIDDFSIETDPLDVTGPAIAALSPLNGAVNIETTMAATITFDENIQKGTGNIYVKRVADNVIVHTIPVNSAAVTLTAGYQANFEISGLTFNTAYYIEADAGTFEDVLGNDFAGISGSSTWSFTTVPPPPPGVLNTTYNFDVCTTPFSNGFTQFSVTGAQKWECTAFGIDATHTPTGSAPNGVQVNGFSGTNIPNEDWFISPSFDLTSTTFPLLSFWSRNAFNGLPLRLKVSTDYPGTGNPNNYTWTDLNGRFPAQATNVWTLSDNINLTAYKSANTYFAFVYFSSEDDGARWTLDDIRVDNSATPPPPSLTVGTTDMQFTYVASGSSADKTFTFIGNDLIADVTLSVTGDFLLSKDGTSFGPSITYTAAEANNVTETVYVRFAPSQNNQNFNGAITISTSSLSATVSLKGTSIDPATTLEVVNWNMEWFGSTDPSLGPPNDPLQEQNAKTILQNIGADLFALVEVVDESRLANIVSQMPGYSYVICDYGSHTNINGNNPSPLSQAQKEAFVYKTSLFSNITTMPLLSQGTNSLADLSNPAYNYWSSGRFPFLMSADVTLNCVTKNIKFVLCHAKANTSPTATSYERRKRGADTLHYVLNQLFPNDNIIVLGDINDDLDQSITAGFTVTSWNAFTDDAANYTALTLPLSLAGKKSTVEYNDVIDHVIASSEIATYYMPGSANILTDVANLVTNYGNTTSDHYPVFSRYQFELPAAPVINCPSDIEQNNDAGTCGAVVNYTVTYSVTCGEGSLQQITGLASGAVFPVGTTTNTFVVTDAAGGKDTCSFTVTIKDSEKPVIVCPDNITASANTGVCGAVVNYTVTFQDNCAGTTIQQTAGLASGALFPTGTTINTFTVTDEGGNATNCSFIVTVTDNEAPTFTRPADKIIAFLSGCTYDAGAAATGDVLNELDNCSSGIEATYTDAVSTCGNTITITRTWSLADNNGNQAPAQIQTITVSDNNTSYIVYADKEAKFGELNLINGSVGVTSSTGIAKFNAGTVLPSPYFARAKNIDAGILAFVPNRINTPANDGPNPPFVNFSGTTSTLPNLTISASTTVPVSANYKELKIKKNVIVTIAGTLYGKIEIEEGAQVTFSPVGGIINIEKLKVTGRNTAITRIKFGGCTSARIKDYVEIGEYVQMNVDGPKVNFLLGDTNADDEQFLVEGSSNIIAVNVHIKKGSLKVNGDITLMKGWFIAEKVTNSGRLVMWDDNNCTEASAMRELTTSKEKLKELEPITSTSLTVIASPNPSADLFTLHIQSADNTPVAVRISDVSGKYITMRQGVSSNSRIQVGSELKSGLYFVEVIQGKDRKVVRLLKL
jgi:hypothetical protein